MNNCRLDFEDIFSRKPSRKTHKGKLSKIKYLNKPYPSIKKIISIIFNEALSKFCISTTEKIYTFDNFTKQSDSIVSFPITDPKSKKHRKFYKQFPNTVFFGTDLMMSDLNEVGVFWILRNFDDKFEKFTLNSEMKKINENNTMDIEKQPSNNSKDQEESLQPGIIYKIRSFRNKLLIFSGINFTRIFKAESVVSQEMTDDEFPTTDIDYSKLELLGSITTNNPLKLSLIQTDSTLSTLRFIDYSQKNRAEIVEFNIETKKMSSVFLYENSDPEWELNVNWVKISEFRTSMIIFDEVNGLFQIAKSPKGEYFFNDLMLVGDHEKTRFKDACLCYDQNKVEHIASICIVQAHQNLVVMKTHVYPQLENRRKNSKSSPSTAMLLETAKNNPNVKKHQIHHLEIEESKVKTKEILCNHFWNSFFLVGHDDHLWMLEFYPPVYFKNFWINFKYIEESEYYQEKENEFDKNNDDEEGLNEIDLIKLVNS